MYLDRNVPVEPAVQVAARRAGSRSEVFALQRIVGGNRSHLGGVAKVSVFE